MGKTIKRILASVLTVAMLLTAAPLSGFVGLDIDFGSLDFSTKASALSSGSCGENVTYTFDSETGLLTISGTGDMRDYDYNSSPFYYNNKIKSVVINNGVTSIGDWAFGYCSNLTSIIIPNSVKDIGKFAFCSCENLNNVTMPNSVTSIGEGVFDTCERLTSVTISDTVTSISDHAFDCCASLKNIKIPDSVTNIGYGAFSNCTGLTSVIIPDSVTNIGPLAFSYCTGLTMVKIGKGVTSISDFAFSDCSNLKSITIPDSVKSIDDYAFYGCTALKNVYYSGTEEEWHTIAFGSDNEFLLNAKIHYNYSNTNNIDKETFVYEHTVFYDRLHNLWEKNSFSNVADYDTISRNQVLSRVYDSIKDAGEVVSFKFDELQITADYYDAYLADMMIAFAEKTSASDVKLKAGDYYSTGLNAIENFLNSDNEAYKLSDDFKIETAFSSDYDLSDETKYIFSEVFGKAYKNHPDKFKEIFQGFDCANEICEDISVGIDAYNTFKDCYQAYCVSRATKDMSLELFDFFYDVADEMEKTNPKYAGWFRENIDEYKSNSQSDAEYYKIAKKALSDAGYIAYNTFLKDAIKHVTYNQIGKVLGVAAGKVLAVVTAYNVGVALGELIAPTDTDCAYYMFYISPVEDAMQNVLKQYANTMINKKMFDSARKYEVAFNTLKHTNIALYQKTYDFAAKHRILWIKTNTMKQNMEAATFYKGLWQNYICHFSDYSNLTNYKTVGVKCPVDVYLYNAKNELVLAIVNEEITVYKDDTIAVDVYNGHKSISYPGDEDYSIKIISRESGTMNYTIMSTRDEQTRSVEFYDVALTANQQFEGAIPQEHTVGTNEFSLMTNGIEIEPNYDSYAKVNSVSVDNIEMNYKSSATLNPVIDVDEGVSYTVTYTSSDPSVAKVDENGNVYGAKKGSADITVTVTDEYGNSVSDTCTVKVKYSFGQWLIVILLFGWIWY